MIIIVKINELGEKIRNNENLIYQDYFFDELKSCSLSEFRNNINYIQDINATVYLENRVDKYYLQLLEQYDFDTRLFKDYNEIIKLLKNQQYSDIENYKSDIYLVNEFVIYRLNKDSKDFSNINKAIVCLLEETNVKISEIVVSGLFKDTFYNVIINIKEMLRYNGLLNDNEKVLDENKIKFYETIFNIDKVSCEDKILMYKKLKDRNINLCFYDDLRKLKDLCYKKINESLIKLEEHNNFKDVNLSLKYGVDVYDLTEKEYTMLVRSSDAYLDKVDARIPSYSIISNEKNYVFSSRFKKFIYGYSSFDIDCVIHSFERDASVSKNSVYGTKKVNRLMSLEQLIKSDLSYNEINIVNLKDKENDDGYVVPKPDYIIVYDNVLEKDVDESKRLGIPIVIIKKKKLDKVLDNGIEYSYNFDDYTYNELTFVDEYRRSRR